MQLLYYCRVAVYLGRFSILSKGFLIGTDRYSYSRDGAEYILYPFLKPRAFNL